MSEWQSFDPPRPVDTRPLRYVATRDLLQSLDRCEHGRHGGEPCFDCPGQLAGPNPHLDDVIGWHVHGEPIAVRDLALAIIRDNWIAKYDRARAYQMLPMCGILGCDRSVHGPGCIA